MNVALLGPSGAGKGSHVGSLTAQHQLRHVSTGDLLRHHLEHHTALGILARRYMAQAELVPDELVDAMIEAWGYELRAFEGMLFDGFPRTTTQAAFVDEFLRNLNRQLDAVIYLHVPDAEILRRLGGRLICHECQRPYHRTQHPPKLPGVCDRCGSVLYQRPDDIPEMVRVRLRTFHRATEPVLVHYAEAGRLVIVSGEGSIETVGLRLNAVLAALAEGRAAFATAAALDEMLHATIALRPMPPEHATTLDLVLLGAPGSGKGTQAALLARELAVPHIATGDLFRENLLQKTALGAVAKGYMERGELVPDDVTEAMVEERLARADARAGFVLDGFPRSVAQARALTDMLARVNRRVAGAIWLGLPDAVIVERLSGRLVCRACQAPFHRQFHPPAVPGRCDHCKGELYQRADDNPDTVRARLLTFHRQTEPLIEHYRAAGTLQEIDGSGEVRDVAARLLVAAKLAASSVRADHTFISGIVRPTFSER